VGRGFAGLDPDRRGEPVAQRDRNASDSISLAARRQNLFYSATMPRAIRGLAEAMLHDPAAVELEHSKPADTVDHALYDLDEGQKIDALECLLSAEGC